MSLTEQEMTQYAVNAVQKLTIPQGMEAIVIVFEPKSMSVGWTSSITKPEMLSIVSDVLDQIICAG